MNEKKLMDELKFIEKQQDYWRNEEGRVRSKLTTLMIQSEAIHATPQGV